jgi:hypothetical protein
VTSPAPAAASASASHQQASPQTQDAEDKNDNAKADANNQEQGSGEQAQIQPSVPMTRLPRAISTLQRMESGRGQAGERKFTPMDVDGAEMALERGEGEQNSDTLQSQVKRNPDGSICEDCN